MGPVGFQEILIILVIIVIIFGAKRLPQLGKGMGEALKNFKGAIKGDEKSSSSEDGEDKVS